MQEFIYLVVGDILETGVEGGDLEPFCIPICFPGHPKQVEAVSRGSLSPCVRACLKPALYPSSWLQGVLQL